MEDLQMTYAKFCQKFYDPMKENSGFRKKRTKSSIAEFFFEVAIGGKENREKEKQRETNEGKKRITLPDGDTIYRRWFNGDRSPGIDKWEKLNELLDEEYFAEKVFKNLNDEALPILLENFNIRLMDKEEADKEAFAIALAKQFRALCIGEGEADEIVQKEYFNSLPKSNFIGYFRKATQKYSRMKTFLYSTKEQRFYDFFVCNTVSTELEPNWTEEENLSKDIVINDITLEKLANQSKAVLLVGTGGIGKSMMMKHLFLQSVSANQNKKAGTFPILIPLREFGLKKENLIDFIADVVRKFDRDFSVLSLREQMKERKCQLLFDGLDEVSARDVELCVRQIDEMMDQYPGNQYVITTRRKDTDISLPRFKKMWICPFSLEQALELIDKLEVCPEKPEIKNQFLKELEETLYETHKEFASNPLLLILMFMNYQYFGEVSNNRHRFYTQAYETLLYRHDASKLAYQRKFQSVEEADSFTKVFRELCAKSYRKGDYSFDRIKWDVYFSKLKEAERLNSPHMTAERFLFDACNNVCLMLEEGDNYYFLHRSFQEYFFAEYYARQNDDTLYKLGKYLEKNLPALYDDYTGFDMLYELVPKAVERFILFPYLKEIFAENDSDKTYWKFLKKGYGKLIYVLAERDGQEEDELESAWGGYSHCEPISEVFHFICKKLGFLGGMIFTAMGEQSTCSVLEQGSNWEEKELLEVGFDSITEGQVYQFDFEKVLEVDAKEKYSVLMSLLEETQGLVKRYHTVKEYYGELKEQYEKEEDSEEDDF